MPAASVAVTSKVYLPGRRSTYLKGEVQGLTPLIGGFTFLPLSSQAKVEPASLASKRNFALDLRVRFFGLFLIVVSGGFVSGFALNVATALRFALIVRLHVAPLQSPEKPVKLEPEAGAALRLTFVPLA